jgi:hypothetical protein
VRSLVSSFSRVSLALLVPVLALGACSARDEKKASADPIVVVAAAGTVSAAPGVAPTALPAATPATDANASDEVASADDRMTVDADGVEVSEKKVRDPYHLADVDFSQAN